MVLLPRLPEELWVVVHGYLCTATDRAKLQCVSKAFYAVSNSWEVIRNMSLLFPDTAFVFQGCHSILRGEDSAEALLRKLHPFVRAGNQEALYLLGKFVLYTEGDTEVGLLLLQKSLTLGYNPATYEIAVLLCRHGDNMVSNNGMALMKDLCNAGYEPAMVNLWKYNGSNRRVIQEVARQRLSST